MIAYIEAAYTDSNGVDQIARIDLSGQPNGNLFAEAILTNYAAKKEIAQEGDDAQTVLARALWDLFSSYVTPVAQSHIRDQTLAAAQAAMPKLESGVKFEDLFG